MGNENETLISAFDLSPEAAARVLQRRDTIRTINYNEIIGRIRAGGECVAIKAEIAHGGWLNWLVTDADCGYSSIRTAERDMMLWNRLGEYLDTLDHSIFKNTNVTALFELCAKSSPLEALDIALTLTASGVEVRTQQAEQLVRICAVSPTLGMRVREGDIGIQPAAELADALEVAPAEVIDLVNDKGVQSASVARALTDLAAASPQELRSITASGTLYNVVADKDIPIHEISEGDVYALINKQEAENIARGIEHVKSWRRGKADRVLDVTGDPATIMAQMQQLAPDAKYRVIVYPEAEVQRVG